MEDRKLCISYFDQIIGPNTFYCTEKLKSSMDEPDLGKILEFNDEPGTFIFAFRKYQTVNHLFYIHSNVARGGEELLMISFLIKTAYFKNEIIDVFKYLESLEPILEDYADKIKNFEELPEILHRSKNSSNKSVIDLASEDFQQKFLDIHNDFFEKLSPHQDINVSESVPLKKLFIFGDRSVGKTTFLKNIEAIQFYSQDNNDLPTRIYEMVIENLDILTYDCVERDHTCEKCKNFGGCVSNAQAFILMIDASKEDNLEESYKRFQHIIERCKEFDATRVPILIIGNKINDVEQINSDIIYEKFNIPELIDCGMKLKYFPINIVSDNKGIMKALRWLVRNIL